MNCIPPFIAEILLLKLSPKDLYSWFVLGLFDPDDHFWRRYCIKRQIIFGSPVWTERLKLWMKRKTLWSSLEDTPWLESCQNPKIIWGTPEESVIAYKKLESAQTEVEDDIMEVLDTLGTTTTKQFHITRIGIYNTYPIITPNRSTMFFVRYCPFDSMQVGVLNNDNVYISHSTFYWGGTKDGLRQDRGYLIFDNGFVLDTDWCDWHIMNVTDGQEWPEVPPEVFMMIEYMTKKFMDWAVHTPYLAMTHNFSQKI